MSQHVLAADAVNDIALYRLQIFSVSLSILPTDPHLSAHYRKSWRKIFTATALRKPVKGLYKPSQRLRNKGPAWLFVPAKCRMSTLFMTYVGGDRGRKSELSAKCQLRDRRKVLTIQCQSRKSWMAIYKDLQKFSAACLNRIKWQEPQDLLNTQDSCKILWFTYLSLLVNADVGWASYNFASPKYFLYKRIDTFHGSTIALLLGHWFICIGWPYFLQPVYRSSVINQMCRHQL